MIIRREVHLKNYTVGMPKENDFEIVQVSMPEPKKEEVLVCNIYMSVDPYMRGRMTNKESYIPPFQPGKPLEGGCIGQVVKSLNKHFNAGDYVFSMLGWREYFISNGNDLLKIDHEVAPIQAYLGVMGIPGLTAYVGLLDIAKLKENESVFVSAASGAVGSVVCQIAKIKGCYVIGSTGSDKKAAWLLKEARIDNIINYKRSNDLVKDVAKLLPNGIDVYFENVGGKHLEAALENMNSFGRIALCGLISQYNLTKPMPNPGNLMLAIQKRITMKGFIVSDHLDKMPKFRLDMGKWIKEGRIKWQETVVEGIQNAPRAFIELFEGKNLGKMLVKIGSPS